MYEGAEGPLLETTGNKWFAGRDSNAERWIVGKREAVYWGNPQSRSLLVFSHSLLKSSGCKSIGAQQVDSVSVSAALVRLAPMAFSKFQ